MTVSVLDANVYIQSNIIDIADWTGSDEAKKQRIVNVATRTMTDHFEDKGYVIPDEAVYEFCGVLAILFNDTNRLGIQGVTGFTGAGFTFQFGSSKPLNELELSDYIPTSSYRLIGKENDVDLVGQAGSSSKARIRKTGL